MTAEGVLTEAQAQKDWEYENTRAGNIRITEYKGTDRDVTVPGLIGGSRVTEIGEYAFRDRDDLRSIELPLSIESLEERAFRNCGASIYGPSLNIRYILEPSLKHQFVTGFADKYMSGAKISEDMKAEYRKYINGQKKRLYDKALKNINLLRYMISENMIPKSDIEDVAEKSADAGAEAKAMVLEYRSKILTPQMMEKMEEKKIIAAATGVLTAAQAKKEWKYERADEGIRLTGYKGTDTDIAVPEVIGKDKVTEIGGYAFSPEGPGLRKDMASVRKKIRSVIFSGNIKIIGESAFRGCGALKTADMPQGLKAIGPQAFEGCTGLEKAEIPESTVALGKRAFRGCEALKSITVPKRISEIPKGAFENCTGLEKAVISKGVKKIGVWAFKNCINLVSADLPQSILDIDDSAFRGCKALTDISISKDNPFYSTDRSAIFKGDTFFSMPSAKGKVTVPEGVRSIGGGAFFECSGMTGVVIPKGVTSIGVGAFGSCTGLKSITIPEGVTEIGSGAFRGCSSLKSIAIPEGVTYVGGTVFYGCKKLREIVIPEGVREIDYRLFYECSSLESIELPESIVKIEDYAFRGCSPELVIHGTKGSYAEKYARKYKISFEAR